MFNIVVGITALLYWYVTGDMWPAILGAVLALMIRDDLWLLSIGLSAAIIGLCTYHFWSEIVINLEHGAILGQMAVSCLYMFSVLAKAATSFR